MVCSMIPRYTNQFWIVALPLVLLTLVACDSQIQEVVPPKVSGTVTLDPDITAAAGADLWIGGFTEDMLDAVGAPNDPLAPVFGVHLVDATFPIDYVIDEAEEGIFHVWVGLDNDGDELFCEGDAVGRYSELNENNQNVAVPITITAFDVAGIDVAVDFGLIPPFVDEACP